MGHYIKLHEPKASYSKWQDDPHSVQKRWRVAIKPKNKKAHGRVDWHKRIIEVSEDKLLDMFTTLIHEVIHVAAPEIDEAPVLRIERNCTKAALLFLRTHGEALLDEIMEN